MKTVTVIGCTGALPPESAGVLAGATLVVGAARYLSMVDSAASSIDGRAERLILGDVSAALARLAAHDGPAVVLASGDPGFFGIVRALRRTGIDFAVLPAPSSVATAFARLGLPWDDALVVSAHGRALAPAVNACRAYPKVAVLTGPGAGPAELGTALRDLPRRLVVAERLGTPDERLTETTPAHAAEARWTDPNVVLVLGNAQPDGARWVAGAPPGPTGWALPDAAFAHRMITRAEVRALALARLGPRLGDLVWDVGAGSGSVAVECARFGAAVVAVERDPAACATIRTNAARYRVELAVVEDGAPQCLAELPDPDAVFVGGGGVGVLTACTARQPARIEDASQSPALRRTRLAASAAAPSREPCRR